VAFPVTRSINATGWPMGKRSNFQRVGKDYYPTPFEAVEPLFPHLPEECTYVEPCAGDGRLIDHLMLAGHTCLFACDIDPQSRGIHERDARYLKITGADFFITNPPWTRTIMHEIIQNLSYQMPTWLLLDADWMHTKQSTPFLPWLKKIVSVGRVKWMPNSPFVGKDNCCWYLFDQNSTAPAEFVGRLPRVA
jgi:hypothetical protein